ncbi:DNA excision repair protein ERCC-6 [Schistosoma japonicum]|nr:DNA excision repair protein ERCC-6 [Schistosoma japonicum]
MKKADNQDVNSIQRVVAFDQLEFEASAFEQANNAFKRNNSLQITATKERLLALDDDIMSARHELEKMEKSLDNLLSGSFFEMPHNSSENRKIRSMESEIETKARRVALMTTMSNLEKTSFSPDSNSLGLEQIKNCQSTSIVKSLSPGNSVPLEKYPVADFSKVKLCKNNTEELKKLSKYKNTDDADLDSFRERLKRQRRSELLEKQLAREHKVSPSEPADGQLDGGFCVPGSIWCRLFDYQRSGVGWLWDLHQKGCGGIIGDEMGLGKTIQVIALLAGLHYSKSEDKSYRSHLSIRNSTSECHQEFMGLGPTLIVCPATVLNQWMSEFHSWWPPIRVAILHSTGSGYRKPYKLIQMITNNPGSVLLTTYSTLVTYRDILTSRSWSYIILDEGHKIKNPEAEATSAVKHVETAYQCACTLRDLLKPYLLRRLKSDVQIQLPAKSEQRRVFSAAQAQMLESMISKYFGPIKKGSELNVVAPRNPENGFLVFTFVKVEQEINTVPVMVPEEAERENDTVPIIVPQIFPSLVLLRNLCNHPDLATGGPKDSCFLNEEFETDKQGIENVCLSYSWSRFGCPRRSSKMLVVASLLKNWYNQGHKVLLFSQGRRVLTLLERLIQLMKFSYLRMDGTTPVSQRHELIRRFNYRSAVDNEKNDRSSDYLDIFVFLLTTRVGGLGVNLTSANRVLIYDPDWNPTTDLQARERAWRIGQSRDVVIYRLLTSGTIEEKIYHRQIFKQFLTNRILKNPRQQRFFKTNDLQELLSIDDESDTQIPETALYIQSEGMGHTLSNSFSENRFDILAKKLRNNSSQSKSSRVDTEGSSSSVTEDEEVLNEQESKVSVCSNFSDTVLNANTEGDRKEQLRQLAKEISRRISEEYSNKDDPIKMITKQSKEVSSNKHALSRKRKSGTKGTQVDGKRIKLVTKQCKYDVGEGIDISISRNQYSESLKGISCNTIVDDNFIQSVLVNSNSSHSHLCTNKQDCSLVSSFKKKRSMVDQDMRDEATRVANEALKNIQKLYKSNEIKCKELSHRNASDVAKSKKRKSSNIKHTKQSFPSSYESSNSAKRSFFNTTPVFHQITQMIQHDQLLDEMTNPNHIDVSFDQLAASRLACKAILTLEEEVKRWQQSNFRSLPETTEMVRRRVAYPFGQAKNRFLWNRNESISRGYIRLLQTPNNFEGSTRKAYDENLSDLHVRFSSQLLLGLIRSRKISLYNHLHSLSGSESIDSVLDHSLQRLCAELIRILSGPDTITSEYLTVRFTAILKGNNKCNSSDIKKSLQNSTSIVQKSIASQHFRALLKQLAIRHRAKCNEPQSYLPSRGRLDDVWTLRDKFQPIATYLSINLAAAERLD